MKTSYVWRDGEFVNKSTGEPLGYDPNAKPTIPAAIIHDIAAHVGPHGRIVRSRSDLADVRARSGWIPHERVGEALELPKRRFDLKDDHWADYLHTTRKKVAARAGFTDEQINLEKTAIKTFGSLRDKVAKQAKA